MAKDPLGSMHHHKHWHYIYHRRRKLKAISSQEIMIGQIIAMCGSLTAGLLLDLNKQSLAAFAGAFLLLPGLIDLAASITGAMCAKINHHLEESDKTLKIAEGSVLFALMMSVCAGAVVAVFGGLIGEIFFNSSFWQLGVLTIATMVVLGIVTYPLMALLTVFIRKTGADADNIVGPVETGFTDMLTVIVVAVLIKAFI